MINQLTAAEYQAELMTRIDKAICAVLILPEAEQLKSMLSEPQDALFTRCYLYLQQVSGIVESARTTEQALTEYFKSGQWERRLREALERETTNA
jgi:hypothetical protein